MDLDFNEEQQVLRDMVRGVLAEHCPIEVVRRTEDDPELIDWREPSQNARVLDWRQRAETFGLTPIGDDGGTDGPVALPVDRLIEEDEATALPARFEELEPTEAFRISQDDGDPDEIAEARMAGADVDPVRVYLQDIGRRRLLTKAEEQAFGARIEAARGDLLAQLPLVHRGVCCLLSLADKVRSGEAPAAELILLPDGGELQPAEVSPVLDALAEVRTLVDGLKARDRKAPNVDGNGIAPLAASPIAAPIITCSAMNIS